MTRYLPVAAFLLLPVALSWSRPHAPDALASNRELASLVPAGCAVFLESDALEPWLAQGLAHPLVQRLLDGPLGAILREQAPRSPSEALAQADAWLGASTLASLRTLTGSGVAFAFEPEGKKSLLLARGRNAQEVEAALGLVLDALERQFAIPGALDRPQRSWSGGDVWMLGELALARRDALLVLGNDAELVQDALGLAGEADGRGLLANAEFARAHARRDRSALIFAWIAAEELEPFADQGFRDLRAAERTPAMQGVFGAELAALASAPALSAELALDESGLELRLVAAGAERSPLLAPGTRSGDVPAAIGGAAHAEALLYRDYARFVGERAQLFAPEALPAFAEALSNGALFFEGLDLGDEVLPHLSPWLRLVVREPAFAPERRPEIPLPAAALVAVLDTPEAGAAWQSAFQTVIALTNVDQAQKMRSSLRLALAREGEYELTTARYSTPRAGEGVDLRYNLEPTLAVVGRHLVVASHESLARELVRELAGSEPTSTAAGEFLRLDGAAVLAALRANHGMLVAKKEIEDGLEHERAEAELTRLEQLLAELEELRLELSPEGPSLRARLDLAPAVRR